MRVKPSVLFVVMISAIAIGGISQAAEKPILKQTVQARSSAPETPLRPVMGLNKFDLALQYLGLASGGDGSAAYLELDRAMALKAMFDAHNMGAKYLRVAITGYFPYGYGGQNDLALWQKNPEAYWARIDLMMNDLDKYKLKILPTFLWNVIQFPSLARDNLANMLLNPLSPTYSLMAEYISQFIHRYKRRPTIEGYEIANELNLSADLDLVKRCHSEFERQPGICAPFSNFTTDEMISFTTRLAEFIKSLDLSHFVESGDSLPRACAEHLRAQPEFSPEGPDWSQDTLQQFQNNLLEVNGPFDLISIHLYGNAGSTFYGLTLPEFLNRVKGTANSAGKPLWIGEYGDSDSTSGHDSAFSAGVLSQVVKLRILYSAPWTLEFYQFNPYTAAPFNIEPGYTDQFIQAYERANSELGIRSPTEPDNTVKVILTWPIDGARLASSQLVYATASSGGTGPDPELAFILDGAVEKIVTKPPYTTRIDTSGISPGTHTIAVYAISPDKADRHASYSATVYK